MLVIDQMDPKYRRECMEHKSTVYYLSDGMTEEAFLYLSFYYFC